MQKAHAREMRVAAARAAARRRRLAMLAGVVVAAAVLVAVAVLASRAGTPAPVAPAERAAVFAGIPQDGEWLGRPGAPVTVEEYVDLQCPFCAVFAARDLPAVVRDYVRPGSVRMRLRLLTFLGPDSLEAGRLAAATGLQDRQWDFVEGFYARQGAENSGYVTEDFLRDVAAGAGIDVGAAFARRDDPRAAAQLRGAAEAARRGAVRATPMFRVGSRGGGVRTVGADDLRAAIDDALAR